MKYVTIATINRTAISNTGASPVGVFVGAFVGVLAGVLVGTGVGVLGAAFTVN